MSIKLLICYGVFTALLIIGLDFQYNRALDNVYKHNVFLFENFCAWGRNYDNSDKR
jgi:hypothetical protein